MLTDPDHRRPGSLYQLHVRPFLGDLTRELGRPCGLADIPDKMLDDLAAMGFTAFWLVGVWDRGSFARELVRADLAKVTGLKHHVPDLRDDEVLSSPFSVREYKVDASIGGDDALTALRERLRARGLRLVLDVVVNHTTRDAPWLFSHPDAYVKADLSTDPDPSDYFTARTSRGLQSIALGRDPYFPGWPETAQLDARSPVARRLLKDMLLQVSARCDGIQCGMAMLGLSDVFLSTWQGPHWPAPVDAVHSQLWSELIAEVRKERPDFWFLAEAYWGREWDLQELGFSHTYDKTLYDRLRDGDAPSIRAHLQGNLAYQIRSVRFLENHFHDRAAAVFRDGRHRAAAVMVGGAPGLRMFVQGQLQGRRERMPLELGCHPPEPPDPAYVDFYERLCRAIAHPAVRAGQWRLLGEEMPTQAQDLKDIFVGRWHHATHGTLLFVVNFSGNLAEPRVPVDVLECDRCGLTLTDLLAGHQVKASGREALGPGVLVPLEPWGVRVFEVHIGAPAV